MIPAKPRKVLYPLLCGLLCLIPLGLQFLLYQKQTPFWGTLAGMAGAVLLTAWVGSRLRPGLVMKAALPLYVLYLLYAVFSFIRGIYLPLLQSALLFVLVLPAVRNVSLYQKYNLDFAWKQTLTVMVGWLIVLYLPAFAGHTVTGAPRYMAVLAAAFFFALRLIADRRSSVSRSVYVELGLFFLLSMVLLFFFIMRQPEYAERMENIGSGDFARHMKQLLHTAAPFGSTEILLSDGTPLAQFLAESPAYAGSAILLLFGYVPFLAAFASAFLLVMVQGQMARTAGNSLARHLLDAASAWFLVRLAFLLLDLFVLGSAGEAFPLTGPLFWVLADVLLVAVTSSLYVQSLSESDGEAPEMDLDFEEARSARRLSYYESYLRIEDGRLQEELRSFEGIPDEDLSDEEFDRKEALEIRREEIADELRDARRDHERLLRRKEAAVPPKDKAEAPTKDPLPRIPEARAEESDALHEMPRELIFLSHNHADEAFATSLAEKLEAAGYRCWYCERDIASGEPYTGAVMRGLSRAALCIFLLDEKANASVHIRTEAEVAHEMSLEGLQVLPVYLSEMKLSPELTYSLKIFKKLRLYGLSEEAQQNEILKEVREKMRSGS